MWSGRKPSNPSFLFVIKPATLLCQQPQLRLITRSSTCPSGTAFFLSKLASARHDTVDRPQVIQQAPSDMDILLVPMRVAEQSHFARVEPAGAQLAGELLAVVPAQAGTG